MCGAFLPHRIHLNPAGLGLQTRPFTQQTAKTFTWWKKIHVCEAQIEEFDPQYKGVFQRGGGEEGGRKSWSQGRAGEEVECWNLKEDRM